MKIFYYLTLILSVLTSPSIAAQDQFNDKDITQAVKYKLAQDSAVRSYVVNIEVTDGIVKLDGKVGNMRAKEHAARLAEVVRGVKGVVNLLQVNPAIYKTPQHLRRNIQHALTSNAATEPWEISVTTDNKGSVTLEGEVDSWYEKKLASWVAKGVSGVTQVRNDINVKAKEMRPDLEMKEEIDQLLRWDALIDGSMITVTVNAGRAILSGKVASLAQKRIATTHAWVSGVTQVDNSQLNVTPEALKGSHLRTDYAVKDDSEIRHAVQQVLRQDPRVISANIDVRVVGGDVTLNGKVPSVTAKKAAQQDVLNTVGVKKVNNRLEVYSYSPLGNEALEETLKAVFLGDSIIEGFDIEVSVVDGIATLHGAVNSYYQKARAEHLAGDMAGIIDVKNYLFIKESDKPFIYDPYANDWLDIHYDWLEYKPGYPTKSDEQIVEEIKKQLWWSPFVSAENIAILSDEGVVTLEGEVESKEEQRAAIVNAFDGGAIWVIDRLTITNQKEENNVY